METEQRRISLNFREQCSPNEVVKADNHYDDLKVLGLKTNQDKLS